MSDRRKRMGRGDAAHAPLREVASQPAWRRVLLLLSITVLPQALLWAEERAANTPSPQAVEAIQLLNSTDSYQRQKAFLHLEALREPATVETVKSYLNHRDPELRAFSARALAAIQGAAAAPLLLSRLSAEKQPRVRRAILLGLEPLQSGDPAILPACLKALRDRDPEVRMVAVDIVSRVNDPRAREAILTRYKKERHRDVRRVLELAMKRIGT